ncbi:hypothetical protein ACRAWF_04880 [Streptomyces sp. L7]
MEPGDEVIAFGAVLRPYAACIAMAGGTRVPVTLRPHDGSFRLDLDELRAAVTDRTRLPPDQHPAPTRPAPSSPARNSPPSPNSRWNAICW